MGNNLILMSCHCTNIYLDLNLGIFINTTRLYILDKSRYMLAIEIEIHVYVCMCIWRLKKQQKKGDICVIVARANFYLQSYMSDVKGVSDGKN